MFDELEPIDPKLRKQLHVNMLWEAFKAALLQNEIAPGSFDSKTKLSMKSPRNAPETLLKNWKPCSAVKKSIAGTSSRLYTANSQYIQKLVSQLQFFEICSIFSCEEFSFGNNVVGVLWGL